MKYVFFSHEIWGFSHQSLWNPPSIFLSANPLIVCFFSTAGNKPYRKVVITQGADPTVVAIRGEAMIFRCLRWRFHEYGYGSIPINTIFRGMNIHLPAILMFTRGTRFWHTAISSINLNHDFEIWDLTFDIGWCYFMLFLYLIWVLWRDWVKLFISMKLDG